MLPVTEASIAATMSFMQGCICQIFTGQSDFRLAMTDPATIVGMEVAKLVPGIAR